MTLEEFYDTYKLHRKHSIGTDVSKDCPLYEEGVTVDSYEDEVGEFWQKMLKILKTDYNLCLEVFNTFDLEFFMWFTNEFCEWFEYIIKSHKKIELLETLKSCVDFCNKINVNKMVVHPFIGFNEHTPTLTGINYFEKRRNKQEEYVRICDCGCINAPTSKKCTECGEDISDIAPTLNMQRNECTFVMASLDGTYVFEIKDGEVLIGREHEMKEYLMGKPYVSRQHAKLIKEADKVFIENLSGTNYTFVNNQRIAERTELKLDDEIGLGGNEVNGKRQDEAAYLVLRSI